jgi:hypothetical protein
VTTLRLFAIGFIFICTTVAWMILGANVTSRSGEADGSLRAEVERLWGGEHVQHAPKALLIARDVERENHVRDDKGNILRTTTEIVRVPLAPQEVSALSLVKSDVRAALDLEHRRKGLLWFPTYAVGYEGHYRFVNEANATGSVDVVFPFP